MEREFCGEPLKIQWIGSISRKDEPMAQILRDQTPNVQGGRW